MDSTKKCRNSTDKSILDTDYLSDSSKADGVLTMATYQKRIGKDGTVSYRALVRITGFPPQSATFKSKTKATQWAIRTEIALRDGKYLPQMESKRRTVGDLIDRYINEELPKKQNKSRDCRTQLIVWRNLIGQYSLTAINTDILTAALNKIHDIPTPRGGTKSAATMNRYIAAISVVFSYGYKSLDWLSNNPMEKIRKYTEPRGRQRYLSDDERERLLAACQESKNPILYPVVLLAITTGARKNEILSLKWSDVNLYVRPDAGVAVLQDTKNGERRTIAIVEPALSILRDMAQMRGSAEYLFNATRTDAASGHANIHHAWYAALRRSGISDFRFHDLRHTAASYYIQNNTSLRELADILGHKTMQMTQRYAHLASDHQIAAAQRVMTDQIFKIDSDTTPKKIEKNGVF